jgi:glycosyltransferase involved in cell wall biosynthesis
MRSSSHEHSPHQVELTDNSSVSVVMATYNGKQYLAEQISSVLAELLPGDELIIVDDGSQDGTLELLDSLESPAVHVIRNLTNAGVMATFERGLLLSSKVIIFLCDQDDVWLPGKRSAFIGAFERDPRTLVVVSDAQLIDASGSVTAPSFMATRSGFRGGILSTLVRNRYLGCAMAVRRDLLFAALPIPRSVPMHDMWLGALGSILGRVSYISTPLMQYRRHGGNVSPSRRQGWSRMLRWRLTLIFALAYRLGKLAVGRHTPPTNPALFRRP